MPHTLGRQNDGLGTGTRRRRRPAHSCIECRRRKVKCDKLQPCNHCTSSRRPTACIYTTPFTQDTLTQQQHVAPSQPVQPVFPSPESSNDTGTRPVHVVQIFDGASPSQHESVQSNTAQTDNQTGSQPSPARPNDNSSDFLLQRIEKLEHLFSASNKGHVDPDLDLPTLHALQDGRASLNKSRMFGQSHWTSTVYAFKWERLRFCVSNDAADISGVEELKSIKLEIRSLLQKCKVLAKTTKISRPSRCLSCPELMNFPRLSRDMANAFARLYLSKFESSFRIVHAPSFWSEYEEYWINPAAVCTAHQSKVQLVMAIGSSLSRAEGNADPIRTMSSTSVYAAQNWLAGPLEKDRFTIDGLQVHCLLILARQIWCVGGDLIWVSMGTLIRTAMQMGLHRDPKHFPKMSVLQAEIRRRLWATILEMTVQSSIDSGMPPMLSFEDFDTEPPSNINDDEMNDSTKTLPQHPKDTATDTSAQLILLTSLRSRLRASRCFNGLGADMLYDEVLTISTEIGRACRECSALAEKRQRADSAIFHQNMNDLLLRRFLLPLHRPFANRAATNPLFFFSRKVSLDTAMAILSPEPDEDFAHLSRLSGGFIRGCIMYACCALAIEMATEFEDEGLDTSMQRRNVRQSLVNALTGAISLASDRIRLGETNVKLHLMLKAVLGQVRSWESGISMELSVAQGAKEALEESYAILQENLSSKFDLSKNNETDMTLFDLRQEDLDIDYRFDDLFMDADGMGLMGGMFEPFQLGAEVGNRGPLYA
ncbi:hypothetical protein PV11_07931 [Exophiala sideris]|uniref:Zn(2)-C6 fungal-type domain-containing protein n=1 Tax=Exophiala sideris TaxID=1016849 RepID=A0A0D1Z0F7_9EURO|nr:hypothetical protein PV11_07931 [Exophiala sideris]